MHISLYTQKLFGKIIVNTEKFYLLQLIVVDQVLLSS